MCRQLGHSEEEAGRELQHHWWPSSLARCHPNPRVAEEQQPGRALQPHQEGMGSVRAPQPTKNGVNSLPKGAGFVLQASIGFTGR